MSSINYVNLRTSHIETNIQALVGQVGKIISKFSQSRASPSKAQPGADSLREYNNIYYFKSRLIKNKYVQILSQVQVNSRMQRNQPLRESINQGQNTARFGHLGKLVQAMLWNRCSQDPIQRKFPRRSYILGHTSCKGEVSLHAYKLVK